MLKFQNYLYGELMNYVSTNKTAESWGRKDIRTMEPDKNADTIIDRVRAMSIEGLTFDSVVDCYKTSLASWRRFYKQDDKIEVEETVSDTGLSCTRIQSMNIIFYVIEKKGGKIETKASLVDFSNHVGTASGKLSEI